MDRYAVFVKENSIAIDYYANVDVIGDPKKTYKHQKYLEKEHGLKPIPVIHRNTDLKWIDRYLDEGYDYIAFGGLAVGHGFMEWLDLAFDVVCNTKNRQPVAKVHGFGIGGLKPILKYPWFSIDTVRCTYLATRGYIPIPKIREGEFDFSLEPYMVRAGNNPQSIRTHIKYLPPTITEACKKWLATIELDLSVLSDSKVYWAKAYLFYFEYLRKSLPFPRPFRENKAQGFFGYNEGVRENSKLEKGWLNIYHSGGGSEITFPEVILKDESCLMLSFYTQPSKRFRRISKARTLGRPLRIRYKPRTKSSEK
jgi:hypothetical protein